MFVAEFRGQSLEAGQAHPRPSSESRDDLVATAIQAADAQTADAAFSEANSLEETLRQYLSEEHLDHPQSGCVFAALGAEGARQAPSVVLGRLVEDRALAKP